MASDPHKVVTSETITDTQIRLLHNSYLLDKSASVDEFGRHLCHVALGECCIQVSHPFRNVSELRYPTEHEITVARHRLAESWNHRGSRRG
jgi:hypothetical protein